MLGKMRDDARDLRPWKYPSSSGLHVKRYAVYALAVYVCVPGAALVAVERKSVCMSASAQVNRIQAFGARDESMPFPSLFFP